MNIAQNLNKIKESIPANVELIAVSKTKPVSDILEAYNSGQKAFGENKVQELVKKQAQLPNEIEWHMIGHIQRNKVKYIAPFVHLIHGVDSLKTLSEINKQASKFNRVINCLLQIKIASEQTKFGLSFIEAQEIISSEGIKHLKNIRILGLMGMASFTNDSEVIKTEFERLYNYFIESKKLSCENYNPIILSMGMSGDYKLAIEKGSNMIRVGSAIFGERNYT